MVLKLPVGIPQERFVAVLESGTSEAEWRQLGTVDLDALCELFFWLSERGVKTGLAGLFG